MKGHPENSEVSVEDLPNLPPLAYIVRPCERYKEEYKDCRRFKERFHQYFIFGKFLDCSQWNSDYKLCMKYRKEGDINALGEIIDNEKERKRLRLEGHYANDIWEKRDGPPPEWNAKLPEEESDKISKYLQAKVANEASVTENSSSCTIL